METDVKSRIIKFLKYEKCGVAQLPLVFDVFFDGFLTDISD